MGVTTPKAQSFDAFCTTWSAKTGVMTTPALAREAPPQTAARIVVTNESFILR